MRSFLVFLLLVSGTAFANPPVDTMEEIDRSVAAINKMEGTLIKELNKTELQTRIVKVRVKQGKKTKVYLTWHPRTVKDIAKDTFLIVGVITKVLPRFHSVSLIAIDPAYMRWSGRVFWNGVVTRAAVHINHFDDRQPQPLYRLPVASPH